MENKRVYTLFLNFTFLTNLNMKKLFTLIAAATIGVQAQSTAQTVLTEDFESVAIPALPATWTQMTKATTGWKSNSGALASTNGWAIPATTKYAVVDEWNNNEDNDSTMLISPVFSLTGVTGAYLTFDYYFVLASYGGNPVEKAEVWISDDGGTTWTSIKTLTGDPTEWQFSAISLAAYDNKPNLKVGFYYNDGKGGTSKLIGMAVDNIKIAKPSNNDVSVDVVTLPKLSQTEMAAANGTTLKFTVMNKGGNAVTSIDAQYKVDGGTAVTQTFGSLNIAPFTTATLTFTTALSGISVSTHTIEVEATQVNGGADANPGDNKKSANFIGASQSTARPCLIEEFSSSTCAPCASFNATFDPFMESIGANVPGSGVNLIKYQMNWPSPGTDPSYNAHGVSRQNYYGVNSIPDHFVNGMQGGNGDQAEVDECKSGTAFMNIDGTYTVTNDSLKINVNVTPFITTAGTYKVYIAAVEKDYYYYGGTTSQKHYIQVMRMMFPSGAGNTISSWSDNSAQNFNFAAKFDVGNNKKLDYHFWTHPKNSVLLVYVQSDASKDILQSKVIEAQWPTNVKDFSNGINHTMVYPNPAQDFTTVAFNLNSAEKVQVQVLDAIGRVVYSVASQQMSAGLNEVRIPTASLSTGAYTIKIQSDNAIATERLSVVK